MTHDKILRITLLFLDEKLRNVFLLLHWSKKHRPSFLMNEAKSGDLIIIFCVPFYFSNKVLFKFIYDIKILLSILENNNTEKNFPSRYGQHKWLDLSK